MLAEELHFGRTANRLYVSPSRVSQLIQGLERRLGTLLVERTSRSVRLTPVGEQFANDAGSAYRQLMRAVTDAQGAGRRERGVLRLGVFQSIRSGLASEIGEAFEARHPAYRVQMVSTDPFASFTPLLRGEIDAQLVRLPGDPGDLLAETDIILGPVLATEERALLVDKEHPLAGLAEVTLEDLAGVDVVAPGGWPAQWRETWAPSTTPSGRPIKLSEPVTHIEEILDLVARSHMAHITVRQFLELFPRPDLVTVPLTGLPAFRIVLARRAAGDQLVDAFVDFLTSCPWDD